MFFLNENSGFLLFLCNDLINQLIRRGTILFSHLVMVKESICKDRIKFSKQSSMSPCPHLLISLSPMAALIRNNVFPASEIPCSQQLYQQVLCLSVFSFTSLGSCFCRAFTIKFCYISNDTLKLPCLISLFRQVLIFKCITSGCRFPLDITCVGCNCKLFRLPAKPFKKKTPNQPINKRTGLFML